MAYRPAAKHWLCKQRPLLGNARNNRITMFSVVCAATVAMQRRSKHTSTTIEGLCFLRCPCQGVTLKTTGAVVKLTTVQVTKQPFQHTIRKTGIICFAKPRGLIVQKEKFSVTCYMCNAYTWRKATRIDNRQTHLLVREDVTQGLLPRGFSWKDLRSWVSKGFTPRRTDWR
jgi:hypothetical protein